MGSGFLFGASVWLRYAVTPHGLQRQVGPLECPTVKMAGQKLPGSQFFPRNHLSIYAKHNDEMAGIAKLWISARRVIFVPTVGTYYGMTFFSLLACGHHDMSASNHKLCVTNGRPD